MQKELLKVKLKPSKNLTVDKSNPNPKQALEQFKDSVRKATSANVENWYEGLKEHLIPAYMFDLDDQQADAIVASYEHQMLKKNPLTDQQNKCLEQLSSTIDNNVSKNMPNATKTGFFVRISTRSAKDGMMFHPNTKKAIQQRFEQLKKTKNVEKLADNDKLEIIFSEFIKQLVVYNGKQAVQLLSLSHRIWQDLTAYKEIRGGNSKMSLIVRPWVEIPSWGEFRGFVYNRKLCAISSYNRAVFFPFIVQNKSKIEQKIKQFFSIIEPKVVKDLKNFICDFAFLGNDLEKMVIVELNQYRDYEGNATNAELFDWVADEKVLKGEAPFEFRILEKPLEHEQLMKTITSPLKVHLGYLDISQYDYEKDHL